MKVYDSAIGKKKKKRVPGSSLLPFLSQCQCRERKKAATSPVLISKAFIICIGGHIQINP